MELFLPSRSSSSTHPVSMLNLQTLSSYFIIIPSKSCYWLTVYDKVSEFCAVHGSLHCCTQRKRKIRTLLQSEIGSDFSCLVGAGVSAGRAAKKAPVGLFCPAGRKRRAAAVRIHPRGCDFGFLQKKKTSVFSTLVFLVGAGGFEQAALSPVGSCLNAIQRIHAAFQAAA